MSLLRFDPSGSLNDEFGITPDQVSSLSGKLGDLRTEMVETDRSQYDSGEIPAEKQPLDARFFWLPEEQLAAYERDREGSELGRIFQVANGMHDQIDAVVVLGIGGSYMGARAMMEACCDPYHNELTRGGRGSKPRMYFEGNNVDNDASASLLCRLAAGGYGDSAAEKRFAIVVRAGVFARGRRQGTVAPVGDSGHRRKRKVARPGNGDRLRADLQCARWCGRPVQRVVIGWIDAGRISRAGLHQAARGCRCHE
jgi:hypothetical protein